MFSPSKDYASKQDGRLLGEPHIALLGVDGKGRAKQGEPMAAGSCHLDTSFQERSSKLCLFL